MKKWLLILLVPNIALANSIRIHHNLETQDTEVGAEVRFSPLNKISVLGNTGGETDVKYAHAFLLSPKFIATTEIGYYSLQDTGDLLYARAGGIFNPIKHLAFFAEYANSISLGSEALAEQSNSRAGAVIDYSGIKLIYRYTHAEFNNMPEFSPQNAGKHEIWASYKFANGLDPYLYLVDAEYSQSVDVNIGLQYHF